jgi:hypothetical protein
MRADESTPKRARNQQRLPAVPTLAGREPFSPARWSENRFSSREAPASCVRLCQPSVCRHRTSVIKLIRAAFGHAAATHILNGGRRIVRLEVCYT